MLAPAASYVGGGPGPIQKQKLQWNYTYQTYKIVNKRNRIFTIVMLIFNLMEKILVMMSELCLYFLLYHVNNEQIRFKLFKFVMLGMMIQFVFTKIEDKLIFKWV